MLCLADVPTFVKITRPYRGNLIAGMRPTIDGERLFEGYACDYHKAALRSYSSIAPPMVGRYMPGQAYLAAQGRVFVVRYAYGQVRTGTILRTRPDRPLAPIDTRPMAWSSILSSRACCAGRRLMMRHSPSVSGTTRQYELSGHAPSGTMAAFGAWLEVRGHGAGALFGRAVRGGRVGEWRLADERVAGILRDRAAAAGVDPFRSHEMRRTSISECSTPAPTWRQCKRWLAMRA